MKVCHVITGFVELIVRPGPAALYYGPVYAANDPSTTVAITATSFNWEEVLTNVVPDYVDGLDCVVSTDTKSYTFQIQNGKPTLIGEGDHHDPEFDEYGHSIVLNDIGSDALASQEYTLTVYPTYNVIEQFRTQHPIGISVGFICVILFCAAVFFSYDFFMRGEARQNKAILDMKRRFVRFISHEIRTPLNTVCRGLELLRAELLSVECDTVEHEETQSDGIENTKLRLHKPCLLDLTGDILENAQSAVTILNDLLNYDKIETGGFQLEVGIVPIWQLVHKTVCAFNIQARKSSVKLNFIMEDTNINIQSASTDRSKDDVEQPTKASDDLNLLKVVGDDMRIRQIILNLVSNSLKFVKENEGVIDVTASYVPGGLPGSRPLHITHDDGHEEPADTVYPRSGAARISVRDNGEGMTQEQLHQLFREGVQFDANKLQAGGGSGLGLYITKGLIEQHGGTICVQSDGQGLGSIFTIELPLYRCSSPSDNSSDSEISNIKTTSDTKQANQSVSTGPTAEVNSSLRIPSAEQHRHILVVDDAAMNRKMLIRLLEWAVIVIRPDWVERTQSPDGSKDRRISSSIYYSYQR